MAVADPAVAHLWQQLMPRRQEFRNRGRQLISLQQFPANFQIHDLKADTKVQKWAAIALDPDEPLPAGMSLLERPGGLYACFYHRGKAADFPKTMAYIHGQWLSQNPFAWENRPQFELLDERYLGVDHPDSLEQVFVPIRRI